MLGEFDYARRELTTIKKRLQELATPAPQGESRELSFLKARTLDLLQHIYVDSKLTLDHISETFKTASTKQVLEAVGCEKLGRRFECLYREPELANQVG